MDELTYQQIREKAAQPGGMAEIERSFYRKIFEQIRDERDEYRWLHEVATRCLRDRDHEIASLRAELQAMGVTPVTQPWVSDA